MKLHIYKIGYTTHKLFCQMKEWREPFQLQDVERFARDNKLIFHKEVRAFSAEDALTQLRATEGGSMHQPPFVITIVPLEDE